MSKEKSITREIGSVGLKALGILAVAYVGYHLGVAAIHAVA